MTDLATRNAYAAVTEPATLTIERMLPGPIERCFDFLTKEELRRQWFASGSMELAVGAPFALTWKNDELTTPPGQRPAGFSVEHTMQSRITELDPPRKLGFTWGENGAHVSIALKPVGDKVLLTLTHTRLPERAIQLKICAGWHSHLDLLVARMEGRTPPPFWDGMAKRIAEYDARLPK